MATTNREVFRFFHLPRELRNAIYTAASTVSPKPYGPVTITHLMRPELRLVCKRIQQEYDEETFRQCKVAIWIEPRIRSGSGLTDDEWRDVEEIPLVYQKKIRGLELNVSAMEAYNAEEVEDLLRSGNKVERWVAQYYPEWPGCSSLATMFATYMGFFTGARKLDLRLDVSTCHVETHGPLVRDLLRQSLHAAKTNKNGSISKTPIDIHLTVSSQLFDLKREGALDSAFTFADLDACSSMYGNWIVFRAKLTEDPRAFHGLELEALEVGEFDSEGFGRQAQQEYGYPGSGNM